MNFNHVNTFNNKIAAHEKSGIFVVRRRGESDEDLLRRFRKKYSKSGIVKELKERMYYEKPSDKKRRKRKQAQRTLQREEEKFFGTEQQDGKKAKKRKQKQQIERIDDYDQGDIRQNRSRVSKGDKKRGWDSSS